MNRNYTPENALQLVEQYVEFTDVKIQITMYKTAQDDTIITIVIEKDKNSKVHILKSE